LRSFSEGEQDPQLPPPLEHNLEVPLSSETNIEISLIPDPEVPTTSGQGLETLLPLGQNSKAPLALLTFPDLISFSKPELETFLFLVEEPPLVPLEVNSEALISLEVKSEASLPSCEGQGIHIVPTETKSLEYESTWSHRTNYSYYFYFNGPINTPPSSNESYISNTKSFTTSVCGSESPF